jgi:hypothetical protein
MRIFSIYLYILMLQSISYEIQVFSNKFITGSFYIIILQ